MYPDSRKLLQSQYFHSMHESGTEHAMTIIYKWGTFQSLYCDTNLLVDAHLKHNIVLQGKLAKHKAMIEFGYISGRGSIPVG